MCRMCCVWQLMMNMRKTQEFSTTTHLMAIAVSHAAAHVKHNTGSYLISLSTFKNKCSRHI